MKRKVTLLAAAGGVVAALAVVILFRGAADDPLKPTGPAGPSGGRGFSFLEVGPDTLLTWQIRSALEDQLGLASVQYRSRIDLTANYKGFLRQHFPDLHALNLRLNPEDGTLREYDTTKLTFRYIDKTKVALDYVEMLFSTDNKTPLTCKVVSTGAHLDPTANLTEKYGKPRTVWWGERKSRTDYWKMDEDILMVSMVLDRLDRPQWTVLIYYVGNIGKLLDRESPAGVGGGTGETGGRIPF